VLVVFVCVCWWCIWVYWLGLLVLYMGVWLGLFAVLFGFVGCWLGVRGLGVFLVSGCAGFAGAGSRPVVSPPCVGTP
jgi:hypothetical protein